MTPEHVHKLLSDLGAVVRGATVFGADRQAGTLSDAVQDAFLSSVADYLTTLLGRPPTDLDWSVVWGQ